MRYDTGSGMAFGFEDLPHGALERLRVVEAVLYRVIGMGEEVTEMAEAGRSAEDIAATVRLVTERVARPVHRELLDAHEVTDRSLPAMGARYEGPGSTLAKLLAALKLHDAR